MENNHVQKELIISYIKDKNLTKTKFCKNCKISVNTLNNILNNKPFKQNSLFKIARYMGIYFCLLFDNELMGL